jgi:hypothetical protein
MRQVKDVRQREPGTVQRDTSTLEDFSRDSDAASSSIWRKQGLILLLLLLTIAGMAVSPIPLSYFVEKVSIDWADLSDAGQTYGAVSAFISGFALFAVSASLVFQARQTRMMQEQAGYLTQLELFRTAYAHPELQ